jgi:uncharacterized protein
MMQKKIIIAGGTGLIGQELSARLLAENKNYTVVLFGRKAQPNAPIPVFAWDLAAQTLSPEAKNALDTADVIINLAGAGIADKRWTAARKNEIITSRTQAAQIIANYLLHNPQTPLKTYVSASAIGFYGNRAEQNLFETDAAGTGFLAESTQAWEKAVENVARMGIRTVVLRIGIVLSMRGGALEQMLLPFKFRLGAYFDSGKQWYSWIHISDMCRLFQWAFETPSASGVYNATAPVPLRIYDLTKAIGKARGGFYFYAPVPRFVLRIMLGEMADVVLNSTRVSSRKLENQGFKFLFNEAVPALENIFKEKI